jgi:hypothetical protein
MNRVPIAVAMAAAAVLVLPGCGGRPARPVAAVQSSDGKMNCELLHVEYASNETRANALVDEKKFAQENNAAKVVFLGLTGILTMDLKDSERIEMNALKDRNDHLAHLMSDKGCPDAPPLTQPANAADGMSKDADASAPAPQCKDVGGYEAYLKKTGKVCVL